MITPGSATHQPTVCGVKCFRDVRFGCRYSVKGFSLVLAQEAGRFEDSSGASHLLQCRSRLVGSRMPFLYLLGLTRSDRRNIGFNGKWSEPITP